MGSTDVWQEDDAQTRTLCNLPLSFVSDNSLDLLEKAICGQEQDGGGGGGDVGGGKFINEKACQQGGKSAQARRKKHTRAQLQRVNRIGPEDLGDLNDVEEEDEENEEQEEQEAEEESDPSQEFIPEKAILSKEAINIVSALAAVARDCLLPLADSGIISNTHAVIQALQVPSPENELQQLDSRAKGNVVFLAALAMCCQRAEILEAQAHLSYWLCILTFACQMNRYIYLSSDYFNSVINTPTV